MVIQNIILEGRSVPYPILFDDEEQIIELPTRFAISMASKTRYSNKSVQEYLRILKLFCEEIRGLDHYKNLTIDEIFSCIGPRSVENWLYKQKEAGLKPSTLRVRDAVLKTFMEWLTTHEAGLVRNIKDHPYSDGKLKTISPNRTAPKYLTYTEVNDFILLGFKNESERCLMHFLFDTGVRVSEVCRVLVRDLPDLRHYPLELMYFPLLIRGSKGRGGMIKERYTIISRPVVERINLLHNNWRKFIKASAKITNKNMPVFLNVRGKAITHQAIQQQVYLASKKLLISGLIKNSISPHKFRHGTAFSILSSNHGREFLENLVVCQRVLGHNDIKTTEVYTSIPAPVIAKIQQLASIDGHIERFQEADYIFKNTFKPQKEHTEKRGHGTLKHRYDKDY